MFDRVIVVDWSAANLPTSATNRANAVWIGCHDAEGGAEWHHRTRAGAEAQLATLIETARAEGLRILIGFDFAMGYPADTTEALYRNSMSHIVHFLEKYHPGHYKVFNL